VAVLAACDRAPKADDLPVWKPGDHHSADDDERQGQQGQPQPGQAPKGNDTASLVDLAWRQQCVQCHGAMGRGDGQMGAMLHAADLTNADWQSKASDADIAAIIRNGKDKMPSYASLPGPVVDGLVARIRQLRDR
jgi:mono/diheme cytochrome c family protein